MPGPELLGQKQVDPGPMPGKACRGQAGHLARAEHLYSLWTQRRETHSGGLWPAYSVCVVDLGCCNGDWLLCPFPFTTPHGVDASGFPLSPEVSLGCWCLCGVMPAEPGRRGGVGSSHGLWEDEALRGRIDQVVCSRQP